MVGSPLRAAAATPLRTRAVRARPAFVIPRSDAVMGPRLTPPWVPTRATGPYAEAQLKASTGRGRQCSRRLSRAAKPPEELLRVAP